MRVRVYNAMFSESTSIHWHGMYQRGTPFMDGVAMVSQCPILPQQSFEYDFIADPPGEREWCNNLLAIRLKC